MKEKLEDYSKQTVILTIEADNLDELIIDGKISSDMALHVILNELLKDAEFKASDIVIAITYPVDTLEKADNEYDSELNIIDIMGYGGGTENIDRMIICFSYIVHYTDVENDEFIKIIPKSYNCPLLYNFIETREEALKEE